MTFGFLPQPYLQSGQNIKTVGGESLLGSGNVDAATNADVQAAIGDTIQPMIDESNAAVTRLALSVAGDKTFSVIDYGAVGDGVTDDTAAIQAAMDACYAARKGMVWFPRGRYLVTAQLDLGDVDGNNYMDGAIVAGERGATLVQGPVLLYDFIFLTKINFAVVKDLIFEGNGSQLTGTVSCVVHFDAGCYDGVMQNCVVYNHIRGAQLDWSGTGKCVIYGNYVDNFNGGIVGSSTQGQIICVGNHMTTPWFIDLLNGAIAAYGPRSIIANNYVEGPINSHCILLYGPTASKSIVTGNYLKCGGTVNSVGLRMDSEDSTFIGNIVEGCGIGVKAYGSNHVIANNTFFGVGSTSVGVALYDGTTPSTNTVVTGNLFRNLGTGVSGNSLVCDRINVNGNVFGSDVTNPINSTNWTNSLGSANVGANDFGPLISDARLSSNVALKDANNAFTGVNSFAGSLDVVNANSSTGGLRISNPNSTLDRVGQLLMGYPGFYDDALLVMHDASPALAISDTNAIFLKDFRMQGATRIIDHADNANNAIVFRSSGVPGIQISALTELSVCISFVERLRLTSTRFEITPNTFLSALLFVGVYTFGTLPSAAANSGASARITDCNTTTNGANAAGGGSSVVAVFSNGSNWKVVVG